MLSTPGRSPRLLPPLPSPSPSESQRRKAQDVGSLIRPSSSRPQKRAREVEVLDEDTYVEAIEHIVQRDYFPDIPRLQDRLEWLEAIRTGDPELIRQAQIRIMTRRAERKGREASTPGTSRGTPSTLAWTPQSGIGTPKSMAGTTGLRTPGGQSIRGYQDGGEEEDSTKKPMTNMSLDEFLLHHTSQDNASFAALKERDNRKIREKASNLYILEGPSGAPIADNVASSRSKALVAVGNGAGQAGGEASEGNDPGRRTDGYGSTGQTTSTLDMWPYKAKNTLMYDSSNRDDAPLTLDEISERAMGPPKQVKFKNTRFQRGDTSQQDSFQSVEDKVAILYNPVAGETPQRYIDPNGERGSRKHYDLEDLRRTPKSLVAAGTSADDPSAVASVDLDGKATVYEYVSTPNFIPGEGVDASPFMTWGDIDSTPLRLEAEDTPVGIGGSADGPHFKIPAAAARDEAAINMSRTAARNLKQRQQLKDGKLPNASPGAFLTPGGWGKSPAGKTSGAFTPGKSPAKFSPAAQRLASLTVRGNGTSGFDATLRASYAASPHMSPAGSSRLHSAKKVLDVVQKPHAEDVPGGSC